MPRMTGRDVRKMAQDWPTSRILWHLRSTRDTLKVPDTEGRNGYMPRRINRGLCWSCIGVFRAILFRRGLISR